MRNIKENIRQLENNIKEGKFNNDLYNIKEWGGADVIISDKKTPELIKWSENQSIIIDLNNNSFVSPGNRLIISKYSKELSWLFYELKAIFHDYIDFSNKYQFYGILAESALEFIDNNNKYSSIDLLCHVLNDGVNKILSTITN